MRDFKGRFVKGYHAHPETEFKKGNKGVWLGRKRPDLLKTGATRTMFKKGMILSESERVEKRKILATYNQNQWGKNNPNWRGGIYKTHRSIRTSPRYKRWMRAIKKRDNYMCVLCGGKEKIQADHIKQFAYYPELRFELSNGRTLCWKCHKETKSYGRSRVWIPI